MRAALVAGFAVAIAVLVGGSAPAPAQGSDPAQEGAWTGRMPWPLQATHAVLLPTLKVLAWEESGRFLVFDGESKIVLWDPATDAFEPAPLAADYNIFCAGHVVLPDGRVLVAGGTELGFGGVPASYLFDPFREAWADGPVMGIDRYYPTLVSLADGRAAAAGGTDGLFQDQELVEVFEGEPVPAWRRLAGAEAPLGEYPWLFLGPDGRIVKAGPTGPARFLDPVDATWAEGPEPATPTREGGAAVVLPGGDRILVAGGHAWGSEPTASAEVLDLGGAVPAWRAAAPLHHARRDHQLTLLPDGTVLAVGGSTARAGALLPGPGVFTPELYDPASDAWTALAPHEAMRSYHATATLLPDGRVLVAGGETEEFPSPFDDPTGEIFSPPYLFRGPRAAVTEAPTTVSWGTSFPVAADPAVPVDRVTLARISSSTHQINSDQRLVELAFDAEAAGRLAVGAPRDAFEAPPGWYLLFLLSPAGVPSTGAVVQVGG